MMTSDESTTPFNARIICDDVHNEIDSTDHPKPDWIARLIKYLHEEFPMDATTLYGLVPLVGLACSFITCGVLTEFMQRICWVGDLEMVWYACALLTLCLLQSKWGWDVSKKESSLNLWLGSKAAELFTIVAVITAGPFHVNPVLCPLQLCFIALLMFIVVRKYKITRSKDVSNIVDQSYDDPKSIGH